MTLIVSMKSVGGIILGADSRGTVGDPRGLTAINDNYEKIFQVGNCGIAVAGASEMGSVLLDELGKNGINNISDVDEAVQKLVRECQDYFKKWFQGMPHNQRPGVLLTLAGYRFREKKEPEPMIYLLNSQANFAPQLFPNMPCLSGVPQYAVYLAHKYYDQSISLDRAKALTEYLISETASQDPKVGGPIRIAEITQKDGFRRLTDDEVSGISDANKGLNTRLRKFFLKGDGDEY